MQLDKIELFVTIIFIMPVLTEGTRRSNYNPDAKALVGGMGLITASGPNLKDAWKNTVAGNSAIGEIHFPQYPQIKIGIAGIVKDFDPVASLVDTGIISKSELRFYSLPLQLALKSAHEALVDANLIEKVVEKRGRLEIPRWKVREGIDPNDILVIGSTGVGGSVETGIDVYKKLEQGITAGAPDIFRGLPARAATVVSLANGTKGGAFMVGAECASSNYALGVGLDRIRNGRSKIVVVVGTEAAIIPEAINMFEVNGTLSYERNPQKAPQAFEDPTSETFHRRKGFVMGVGSGTIVLIEDSYARQHGLPHHGIELAGYGDSTDAISPIFPDPEGDGTKRAIEEAIKDAGGISKKGKVVFHAHATGTGADQIEAKVIRDISGPFKRQVAGLTATKPIDAHLLGAASIKEAVETVMIIKTGDIPPVIKSENPDPVAVEAGMVRNDGKSDPDVDTGISTALGFGGTNSAVLFRRI